MRLTSEFRVKALVRRVHDAGGSAMILAKGEAMGGAVLAIAQVPGAAARMLERGLGGDGLIAAGPAEAADSAILDYWRRRRARDPDLWVVEVIVVDAERFVAETIAAD